MSGRDSNAAESHYTRGRLAKGTKAAGKLESSVRFNARAGDEISGERWKPSVGVTDSSWCGHSAWLAPSGREAEPERFIAVKSFHILQETTVDGTRRGSADGAHQFRCHR